MATQKTRQATVTPMAAVDLLTIDDTAGRLQCSRFHVYRLINAGLLKVVDISLPGSTRTRSRVRSDDLQDYINSATRGRAAAGDAA